MHRNGLLVSRTGLIKECFQKYFALHKKDKRKKSMFLTGKQEHYFINVLAKFYTDSVSFKRKIRTVNFVFLFCSVMMIFGWRISI
jgi:hypothetical protein